MRSLPERDAELGARSLRRIREMASTHAAVREARGCGLLMAVEFREDLAVSVAEFARAVMIRCLGRGLSVSTSEGCAVTLSPSLIITEAEMDRALTILDEAISETIEAGIGEGACK